MKVIFTYPAVLLLFVILETADLAIANFKAERLSFLFYAALAMLAAVTLVVYVIGGA